MGKEMFENLAQEDQIKLIYCKSHITNEKVYINYTLICDVNSVTEDLPLLEKIAATMIVIRELLSKYRIDFSYTIKSSDEFDNEIRNNRRAIVNRLNDSEIMHCKDQYYQDIIDESKKHNTCKRA